MKKILSNLLTAVVIAAVLTVILGSVYVVNPNEYVAVRQLGKIVRVDNTPGLRFKLPVIQTIQRISGKVIIYDIDESDVITRDKKSMIADNFVLWRVTDPMAYIRTLNAIEARAEERIDAAVYNALKNTISSMNQDDIIQATGEKLTNMITTAANKDIGQYGLEIVTSQIKMLGIPSDNEAAVYERMISERQNIAASYVAEGEAEAQKFRNATDREAAVIRAEAEKQAALLEAEGEEAYLQILREAYDNPEKAEFYEYLRGLESLKASFTGEGRKVLVLDKDSELAQILYGN